MVIRCYFKRLLCLIIATLGLLPAPNAFGQFGEAAGIAEAMTADYLRRDVVFFQQGLNLDDAQRDVIEALYMDYEQEFQDGLARMRKRIEDMRDELQTQDPNRVLRIVFRPIEEWAVEKRAIGHTFLENVKVVLTPEQLEQWPKFERFLFREKHLHNGSLSGESLNLFHVVRDMELTDPQSQVVQAVLDAYDVELDAALRARQNAVIGDQQDMLRSFAEQDANASLAILQRQIDAKIRVREVNDRYIELLTEVMPADRREDFRQKALERAYPQVYRMTPVQNIFKTALGLEDLDASTRQAVAALEAAFLNDLRPLNAQLASAVRQWQPREERLRAEAFAQRMAGHQPAEVVDETRAEFVTRDELSRDYVRQLKTLLTDTQFAQLPGGYRWADMPAENKPANPGESMKARSPDRGEAPEQPGEQAPSDDGGGFDQR